LNRLNNANNLPPAPARRTETLRQELVRILGTRRLSIPDLAFELSISEEEVSEHLLHVRKSLKKTGKTLVVTPPECLQCGFVYRKREKLKKPGRCPVCRSHRISDPLYSIEWK